MKKIIKSFICLFLITTFSNATVLTINNCFSNRSIILVTAPPTITTPIYLCQNSAAVPLTAIFSVGAIHNWYGTTAVGGIASPIAPTPDTTSVGSTTYYVSQTIGGVESSRVSIVVNVVADNGATILTFRCDASQILAADKNSSVFFDWANNPLISDNSYNYSYSIQGGAPVTGNTGFSHYQVFGMLPGQSATLILTAATHPCATQTLTCSVPCGASSVTPTFASIQTTYCINDVPASLSNPTNSPAITGTWSPATISTTTAGTTNYIFTPDPKLFPCALSKTLPVTVKPLVVPVFIGIPTTVCQNSTAPVLPKNSANTPSIAGVWNPAFVDTSVLGNITYTFTPNAGQCASITPITVSIDVVNPANTLVKVDWTVTNAFADNQIVTVSATAPGNYLYQLDYGPFQDSPIFEYVASGTHSITVKDFYGCNTPMTVDNVLVINYPKFFTPNGDGFNDTWNIFDLKNQLDSRIYIFDRYGKLLKEISPSGAGWDGNYTGHPMPSTDYWFTVEYTEQNNLKKFKSHFSLKR
ncbi:T9SS type B sorting domain-containing protein [Flavobacterium sp.]|uniref:T9SS type B sorting domain-containing protein n=1 Tax=Flavobacterium sp. TaxID=239 RepID=UPI0037B169EA